MDDDDYEFDAADLACPECGLFDFPCACGHGCVNCCDCGEEVPGV